MRFHFILLLNPLPHIVPPPSAYLSPLSPNPQGWQCCPALPVGTVAASKLSSWGKIIPSCISFASCCITAFGNLLCYGGVLRHGLRGKLEKTAGNLDDFCSHLRMRMGVWVKEVCGFQTGGMGEVSRLAKPRSTSPR